MTPFHLAADEGKSTIVEYLVEVGSDINATRKSGIFTIFQNEFKLIFLKNRANGSSRCLSESFA